MPRRRVIAKREILPDPVYNSPLVAKFINTMMWDGKKAVAVGIIYSALEKIKERTQEDPLKVFKRAVENVSPRVEVKSRRAALAMRWLVIYSRTRGEKTMIDKLAGELLDAAAGKGNAIKKREDIH